VYLCLYVNLKGRDHLGDLGADGRTVLTVKLHLKETECEVVDWINLILVRVQ